MMEIIRYVKSNRPGVFLGSFDIRIAKWGIIVYSCGHFCKNSHEWVTFPSQKKIIDGEEKYFPHLRFESPEHMKKFSDKCIELIKQFHYDNPTVNN